MSEYNLVVVAKGSEAGHRAAIKAAEIAKENKLGKIYFLFVNDTDFYSGGGISYLKDELEKGLENIGDAIVDKLSKLVKKIDSSIEIEKIELVGKTAEEILKFVNENKVGTLIIPRDKRGPIEKSIVGGDVEPFFNEIRSKTHLIVV